MVCFSNKKICFLLISNIFLPLKKSISMEQLTFIELAKLLISFAVLAPSGHKIGNFVQFQQPAVRNPRNFKKSSKRTRYYFLSVSGYKIGLQRQSTEIFCTERRNKILGKLISETRTRVAMTAFACKPVFYAKGKTHCFGCQVDYRKRKIVEF